MAQFNAEIGLKVNSSKAIQQVDKVERAVGLCAVQAPGLARGVPGAHRHEGWAGDARRWRLGEVGAGRSTLTRIDPGDANAQGDD